MKFQIAMYYFWPIDVDDLTPSLNYNDFFKNRTAYYFLKNSQGNENTISNYTEKLLIYRGVY